MPASLDFSDSLSPVVADYRRKLAAEGYVDSHDDYEVVRYLAKQNPKLLDDYPEFAQLYGNIREANAPSLGAETGRAFKRAGIGLGGTALSGAALLTGSDVLKRKAAALDLMASDPDLAATIPTMEDVRSGRDVVRYGLSKVGEAAPSVAESVAVAGLGALAGTAAAPGPGTIAGAAGGFLARSTVKAGIREMLKKGAREGAESVAESFVKKQVLREASEEAIEEAMKAGVKPVVAAVTSNARRIAAIRGGTAANVVNSYGLSAGEIYAETDDRGLALGFGAVAAVPDTILPAYLLHRMFPGAALNAAREQGRNFVARLAREAVTTSGIEASTEAFQEAVNVVARNLKVGREPLDFDAADFSRMREAAVTGAAGGALTAPAAAIGGQPVEETVVPKPAAVVPAPPAAIVPPAAVAPPVVSPYARVRAMLPEQQTARLVELEANAARTADEEVEYVLLRAVAPRPPAPPVDPLAGITVSAPVEEPPAPPEILPAVPPPTPPIVPPVAAPAPPAAVGTPVAPAPVIAEATPAADETVVGAAVRGADGVVRTGQIHGTIEGFGEVGSEDGFVTDKGRFVTREEADGLARQRTPMDVRGELAADEIDDSFRREMYIEAEMRSPNANQESLGRQLAETRQEIAKQGYVREGDRYVKRTTPVPIGDRGTPEEQEKRNAAMLVEQRRIVAEHLATPTPSPEPVAPGTTPPASVVERPALAPIGSFVADAKDSTGGWMKETVQVLSVGEPRNIRGKSSGGNWAVDFETPSKLGKTGRQTRTKEFANKKEAAAWVAQFEQPAAPQDGPMSFADARDEFYNFAAEGTQAFPDRTQTEAMLGRAPTEAEYIALEQEYAKGVAEYEAAMDISLAPVAEAAVPAPKPVADGVVIAAPPAVERAVSKLADKKQLRVQKEFLADAVKKAIAEAPEELVYSEEGKKDVARMREKGGLAEVAEKYATGRETGNETNLSDATELAIRSKHADHVTIEVPGDGTFRIPHTKEALKRFGEMVGRDFGKGIGTLSPENTTPSARAPGIPALNKKPTPADIAEAVGRSQTEDDTRYAIKRVVQDGKYTVATDGKRLTIALGGEGEAMNKDREIMRKDGTGVLKVGTTYSAVTFPNWRQVIPKEVIELTPSGLKISASAKTAKMNVEVDAAETLRLARLASLASSEKSNSLKIYQTGENGIGFTAQDPDFGEYHSEGTEGNNPDGTPKAGLVAVDPKFLIDALAQAREMGVEKVRIIARDEVSPIVVTDGKRFATVIMPVRLSARGSTSSGVDPTAPNALQFRDARPDEVSATDRQVLADYGATFGTSFTAVEPDSGAENNSSRLLPLHADAGQLGGARLREERMVSLRRGFESALGKRIIFFRSGTPISSHGLSSLAHPNVILINSDAPNSITALIGHELGHDLKNQRPDLHKTLTDLILQAAPPPPSYLAERRRLKYSEAELLDEYVSDIIGDRFTEKAFWDQLGASASERGLGTQFQELVDWVRQWIDAFLSKFASKRGNMSNETQAEMISEIDVIRQAVADAVIAFAGNQPPAFRTSTEPTNPAVQANRTKQFQATMARMVSNGADVQAMSRELLIQQTGEALEAQIAALQTRLAQATTEPQRAAIQTQIVIRQQRLAEVQQMRGVTYSPFHIAIAMDDVMNANVDNLVTLLHEAAESLTMRLTPEMQGRVFRAVAATTAEMTAKMQAAARNTGATVGNVAEPGELLAESLAQRIAAAGVPESPSLAQAIVRWVKEIYYRVAMAAQRAFGAEPNAEMALRWYENQLRRELGGDYEFAFANLLNRFLPVQNQTAVQRFTGASRTPGGIVDFVDPITNRQRQPWVEPLGEDALAWNMRFSTAEPNPGDADGIPLNEAYDRQTAAAYNAEIEFLTKLKADIAPDMSEADFWQQVGRGEKSPAELLAVLEGQRAGVSEARIGGERMTDTMNGLANQQVLLFARGVQTKNLGSIAKMQTAVGEAEDSFTEHARELNRLEPDVRNAELHETELKKRARLLIDGLVKSYARGIRTAAKIGSLRELVEVEEGLGPNDPLPAFYDEVFNNLREGGIPLFEYIEAIAMLDMPLATMTPTDVWKAIRDNADTSQKLRELSRNKPLSMTLAVMASEGARQVDQIQLRRVSGKEFRDIHADLEGIRNATEAQLRAMLRTLDERNNAKGLRQRLKLEYLKERRALQRASDRIAAAEARIDLLERAQPAINTKVGEAEQAIGGIFSEWQPKDGDDFTVMRSQPDGTFQKAVRRLSINADGAFADSGGVLNDIAQNFQWLRANQERAGQKEYQRIEQQTYAMELLDVARTYQAANFGKIMGFVDAFVRPLQAIARQAGHSSGARVVGQFNRYEFINRSGAKALTNAAKTWDHAWQSVQKSTGIRDHGQFRRQVYNPVMFYLGVNPGFDQSQAIRAAIREARRRLATEPTADFDARFERLLLADKAVNDELRAIAEQHGVLVSDPKLGGDLRRAMARGWLTGMRGMNAGVVVTLVHDMEAAGWKLAFDPDSKTKRVLNGLTFAGILPPKLRVTTDSEPGNEAARAEVFKQLDNTDALRTAITPYFTAGILDRWLKPFINKPGESVFSYDGRDISQLDLQSAWAASGGDVLSWIDNLGQKVDVTAEDGTSAAATFRASMLKQIDALFAWEARMAYEAEVVPDLFANQGSKMHVLMDARVNDLMPEEHVDFAMHDPQSTQQMLGQIAFHGAFGRNGQALVANLSELGGVTQAKKFAFESLESTTVEGRKREAKERGYDYDDLNRAVKHAHDIMELKGEIESAMGVNNIYGPLHDARAGLEILGFIVGQAVDQPKTAALNLLSIGARPFAMHSLGPRVIKATALSYGEFAKNSFGGFLRDFGLDIIRMSTMAKEVGEVEGKAFRRLPWTVAISDIGREGSFQNSLMERWVIRPLRGIRSIQKKGFGPGLATLPGAGTLARFSTEAAIGSLRGQAYLMQEIINNGIDHFASHPEDLANPAFRFDKDNLRFRTDKGVYDWFRNKTVEYNMGPIEAIVRGAIERQAAGERTITTEMVEQLAQMNAQELDGASSINTRPAGLANNPALSWALPLLRWPLWMMHAAHEGLAGAEGRADFKSMMAGLARLAAWNLPLGLAFTFMVDEYDEKILGKKNAMPAAEKVGAVPFVGPALALATTDRSIPQEALAIGQRMIRSGNVYGLGADMLGAVITPFDPGSGQRLFSLDQRVLVMSQLLNIQQAVRNMVSQGGTATWGSVYRPLVASIGGNGMLNSLGVVNNLLDLDNAEARNNNRINAARWVNTAAKEIGIATKNFSGSGSPTPMSVWTRQMQLAAQANDRMGFVEAHRRALDAARERVAADDRIPIQDREKEAEQRVMQSWRARNPFSGLAATPTPEQINQLLRTMDDDGRADVQEAAKLYEAYTQFIVPSPMQRYLNQRIRPPNPMAEVERMRRQAAGAMFAP